LIGISYLPGKQIEQVIVGDDGEDDDEQDEAGGDGLEQADQHPGDPGQSPLDEQPDQQRKDQAAAVGGDLLVGHLRAHPLEDQLAECEKPHWHGGKGGHIADGGH